MTGIGWVSVSTFPSIVLGKVVAGFVHAKGTRCARLIIHGSVRFAVMRYTSLIIIIHGSSRFAVMRYTSSMTIVNARAMTNATAM